MTMLDARWPHAAAWSIVDRLEAARRTSDREGCEVIAHVLGLCRPEDATDHDLECFIEARVSSVAEELMRRYPERVSWSDVEDVARASSTSCNPYALDRFKQPPDPRMREPLPTKLLEAIRRDGVVVPIIVSEVDGRMSIVHGMKRWRCALAVNDERLMSGEPLIRRIAIHRHDGGLPESALLKSTRGAASPMARSRALRRLVNSGMTVAQAGSALGLRRRMATYYLRLEALSRKMAWKVERGDLPFRVARELARTSDEYLQLAAWQHVMGMTAMKAASCVRHYMSHGEWPVDDEVRRTLSGALSSLRAIRGMAGLSVSDIDRLTVQIENRIKA